MSMQRDHFIRVLSQPRFYVLRIHHHRWTNRMDQQTIYQIPKPLPRGQYCQRDMFGFNDTHSSMFETVFVLYILQKDLLVLASIRSLVFRINVHRLVPLPTWLQLPERSEEMCRNVKQTGHWSDFNIVFGQRVAHNLYAEVLVFLPFCVLLSQSSHNAIHMIEPVIVNRNDMMQSNCMRFRHLQGPVSEWLRNIHDVFDDHPVILCCEECPVISKIWILQPLAGEFS